MNLIVVLLVICAANSRVRSDTRVCGDVQCSDMERVCGIRQKGEGYSLRLFQNECDLLKHGCDEDGSEAYNVTSMVFCNEVFKNNSDFETENIIRHCKSDCPYNDEVGKICGIKKDGEGLRVRIFEDKCQLWKANCENNNEFVETDPYICNRTFNDDFELSSDDADTIDENMSDIDSNVNKTTEFNSSNNNSITNDTQPSIKNIIVVDHNMINFNNINESIDNFFAATHVFDLPMRELDSNYVNESTRRRLIKILGPVKVFKPWVVIPENISDTHEYEPTLRSCYHKCPTKCPDTYAPVCGVPGIVAREPSLTFQNHCYMDVAQCKMYYENKSPTAQSSSTAQRKFSKGRNTHASRSDVADGMPALHVTASVACILWNAYIESSFLFCLGDEMSGLYRFLPLIKTLQRMGRLKRKGHFRYKLKNMKFFNELLLRQPRIMG